MSVPLKRWDEFVHPEEAYWQFRDVFENHYLVPLSPTGKWINKNYEEFGVFSTIVAQFTAMSVSASLKRQCKKHLYASEALLRAHFLDRSYAERWAAKSGQKAPPAVITGEYWLRQKRKSGSSYAQWLKFGTDIPDFTKAKSRKPSYKPKNADDFYSSIYVNLMRTPNVIVIEGEPFSTFVGNYLACSLCSRIFIPECRVQDDYFNPGSGSNRFDWTPRRKEMPEFLETLKNSTRHIAMAGDQKFPPVLNYGPKDAKSEKREIHNDPAILATGATFRSAMSKVLKIFKVTTCDHIDIKSDKTKDADVLRCLAAFFSHHLRDPEIQRMLYQEDYFGKFMSEIAKGMNVEFYRTKDEAIAAVKSRKIKRKGSNKPTAPPRRARGPV